MINMFVMFVAGQMLLQATCFAMLPCNASGVYPLDICVVTLAAERQDECTSENLANIFVDYGADEWVA